MASCNNVSTSTLCKDAFCITREHFSPTEVQQQNPVHQKLSGKSLIAAYEKFLPTIIL